MFYEQRNCSYFQLPCGQCVGCLLERSRQWAVRCMHEASLHDLNSFVTLTYDDSKEVVSSLRYRDFQLFLKKARRKLGPFSFYMCGEYGERFRRPHYHACLFGLGFGDRYAWRKSSAGFQLYRSKVLEELWGHGNCEVGNVTFESAAYCARYMISESKTWKLGKGEYGWMDFGTGELTKVEPEFNQMSRRPAIGLNWLRLYYRDVYRGDGSAYVVVNGRKVKPPRYYDKYVAESGWFAGVKDERMMDAAERKDDCTPARLAVRETVTRARLKLKTRSLE